MDLGLNGRTAIVCGASSGMGLAIARGLAREGANVVMTARRRELLDEQARAISALSVPADLDEADSAERLVETAVTEYGGLDILVWNTGGPPAKHASDVSGDDLTTALTSMFIPLVSLVRAGLPHLRRSKAGRILAVTSSGVKEPLPNIAISNAMRPGVTGYLKSLSHDVAIDGITVNCLAPGYISTGRIEEIYPDGPPASLIGEIPAGRLGTPEEFADIAVFLASARASYVTGSTISVDGGLARYIF